MGFFRYDAPIVPQKSVAKNRRARHDFQIVDTIEAGIILSGQEVKSCRNGGMNLAGSYVSMHRGSPELRKASIAAYRFASGLESYDPNRDRKLLLKKKDIARLQSALDEKGVSVIPLEVTAGKYIKVVLGLGKGRKKIDKRERIKEKDIAKRMKKGEEY